MPANNTTTLLAAFDAGDEEAGNELFARLMPALRDVASAVLKDPRYRTDRMKADELISVWYEKTFLSLGAMHFTDSKHMIATAYKRMCWTILDFFRKHELVQPGTDQLEQEARTGAGPGTQVANHELSEIIYAKLDYLPDDLQDVIKMRVEGLTFREISEELGISQSTAHDRNSRAREEIRNGLPTDTEEIDDDELEDSNGADDIPDKPKDDAP